MKMSLIKKNPFVKLWLVIGLIAGFSAIIFFALTYLNEKVFCDLGCRLQNEVSLILIFLSLFGVFIGSLTYYFISEKYEKKIVRISKDATVTLKFLDNDERVIVQSLVKSKGKTSQSLLVKNTKLSRVKVSRILSKLEQKDIVKKKPNGMTNYVFLKRELLDIFLK
jgi:Zn-dependent protease with chaperone function